MKDGARVAARSPAGEGPGVAIGVSVSLAWRFGFGVQGLRGDAVGVLVSLGPLAFALTMGTTGRKRRIAGAKKKEGS